MQFHLNLLRSGFFAICSLFFTTHNVFGQNISAQIGNYTSTSCQPGDTISIPVTITSAPGIGVSAISLAIEYDTTKLECLNHITGLNPVLYGAFIGNCGNFTNLGTSYNLTGKQFRVSWYQLNPVQLSGLAFNLSFRVLSPGSSSIQWDLQTPEVCGFYNELAEEIPQVSYQNGSIQCNNNPYNLQTDLTHVGDCFSSVGDTLDVPVTLQNFNGLGISSISMAIDYDSTKLRCLPGVIALNPSLTSGFLSNSGWFNNLGPNANASGSQFRAAWYQLNPVTLSGTLFKIRFITKIPGIHNIVFDNQTPGNCEYSDSNALVIPNTHWTNGSVTASLLPRSLFATDTLFLCGDSTTIGVTPGLGQYLWNTGDTTALCFVNRSGWYSCTVLSGQCTLNDSVYVDLLGMRLVASADTLCAGSMLRLSASLTGPSLSGLFDGHRVYQASNPGPVGNQPRTYSIRFKTNQNSRQSFLSHGSLATGPGLVDLGMNLNVGYGAASGHCASINSGPSFFSTAHANTWGQAILMNEWNTLTYVMGSGGSMAFSDTRVFLNGNLISHGPAAVPSCGHNWGGWNYQTEPSPLFIGSGLGANPPFGGSALFDGDFDYISIWNRALSDQEVLNAQNTNPWGITNGLKHLYTFSGFGDQSELIDEVSQNNAYLVRGSAANPLSTVRYLWSTGDTTASIRVNPTQTTTYTLSVTDSYRTCTDSFTVFVTPNTLPTSLFPHDSLFVCGDSVNLSVGTGYDSYRWNAGDTLSNLTAKRSGWFTCIATLGNCQVIDSLYVSLISDRIVQPTMPVCAGTTVALQTIGNYSHSLRQGMIAHWPFNGQAGSTYGINRPNDYEQIGYTTDRFGLAGRAASLNGSNQYIQTNQPVLTAYGPYTISFWAQSNSGSDMEIFSQACPSDCQINGQFFHDFRVQLNAGQCQALGLSFKNESHFATANTITNDGLWHHYTMVVGSNSNHSYSNIEFYKDGQFMFVNCGHNWGGWQYMLPQVPTRIGAPLKGGTAPFQGNLDEIMVWNRALNRSEINDMLHEQPTRYLWSTGDTTPNITVNPLQTTTYYVTISNGIHSCVDSVTVQVVPNTIPPNFLGNDSLFICGNSILLNAGSGYSTYQWSNGQTTDTLRVRNSGWYKCIVSNGVCSATDSIFVNIFNINLVTNDTLLCNGTVANLKIVADRNKSLYFNGNFQYASNNVGYIARDNFTLEIAAKPNISSGSGYLIGPSHGGFYDGGVGIQLNKNSISIVEHGDGYIPAVLTYNFSSPIEDFIHIALVYSNKSPHLYINGNLVASGSTSQRQHVFVSFNSATWPGQYGGLGGHTYGWFDGWVSKLSIRDSALSSGQIQNIFTQYLNGFVDQNVKEEYSFDGSSMLVANIDSANSLVFSPSAPIWTENESILSNATLIWSTGDTTASITVSPTQTTTYYVTVSNGIHSCTDSVTVNVLPNPLNPNLFASDTLLHCGDSLVLDAGAGFDRYEWSTSDTTQTISVRNTGWYRCRVFDGLCSVVDSVFVSIIPNLLMYSDTAICEGSSVELNQNRINIQNLLTNLNLSLIAQTPDRIYLLGSSPILWSEAYQFADSMGLELYCINNLDEENFVYNSLPWKGNDGIHYWLGLYQDHSDPNYSEPSGGWKWVDNRPLTYSNWQSGEPNNSGGEDYGHFEWGSDGRLWNDAGLPTYNGTHISYPIYEAAASRFVTSDYSFIWSTGDTTASITVTPTQTTTYYVTISNGIHSCVDSVTVNVSPKIFVPNMEVCQGDTINVPVIASRLDSVAAISLALKYNDTAMTYVGYTGLRSDMVSTSSIGTAPGQVRMAWFGLTPLISNSADTLVYYQFVVHQPGSFGWNTQVQGDCELADLNLNILDYCFEGGSLSLVDTVTILSSSQGPYIVEVGDSIHLNVQSSGALNQRWQIWNGNLSQWDNLQDNGAYQGTSTPSLTYHCLTYQRPFPKFRLELSNGCRSWYGPEMPISIKQRISVSLGSSVGCEGDTLEIPVIISGAREVGAVSLVFAFNANSLQLVDWINSAPQTASNQWFVNQVGNEIRLAWFSLQSANIPDGQPLGVLKVVGLGSSGLSWDLVTPGNCEFGDEEASIIPASFVSGSLTIHPLPSVQLTASAQAICPNGGVSVLSTVADPSYTYQWYLNGQPLTGSTGDSHLAGQSGLYQVKVTNTNGCSRWSTIQTISDHPLPNPVVQAVGSTMTCEQPVLLNASATQGNSLEFWWYLNGIPLSSTPSTQWTATQSGDYSVKAVDLSTLCEAWSPNVAININPNPSSTISYTGSTTFCQGDSLTLLANTNLGTAFQWTMNGQPITDATNPTFVARQQGTYAVVVSTALGCTSTSGSINVWVQNCNAINGRLSYNNTFSTPLRNTKILFQDSAGSILDSTTTNNAGDYSFSGYSNGFYRVKAAPSLTWGGVNATDALAIVRHYTNYVLLQGFRLQAADVNGSNNVNNTDALLITRRYSNLVPGFNVGAWLSENPIVQANGQTITQNIQTLCYGDVNGSYNPVQTRLAPKINLVELGTQSTPNNCFHLPIYSLDNQELGAISLAMVLPKGTRVLKVHSKIPEGIMEYGQWEDELRIGWFTQNQFAVKEGEILFEIELCMDGDTKEFGPSDIEVRGLSELANFWAIPYDMARLGVPSVKIWNKSSEDLIIWPNPTNENARLRLTTSEPVLSYSLRVLDAVGREVYQANPSIVRIGDVQELVLPSAEWPKGIYAVQTNWNTLNGLNKSKTVMLRRE